MGRSPCCEKVGLKKGPWTPEEDQKLLAYIDRHGDGSWHALPAKAGLQRCGKSCRLRWINYLKPDIKRGKFSLQEEETMIQLHALLGNRWSVIAAYLPKRTDNEIKNYWNTHVKKKLTKMGIDHVTHKPKIGTAASVCSGWGLNHMAQWEIARLEAEARLVRQSKLQLAMTLSKPQYEPQKALFDHFYETNTPQYSHASHVLGFGRTDHNVLEGDHGVTVECNVFDKGIIGNSCPGEGGFRYGGRFENNDEYWDNNVMSLVDACDFPLDDAFDVSPHFM